MVFNANSAIVELYHVMARKKNYFQRAGDEMSFVIDQHAYQQSTKKYNLSKIKNLFFDKMFMPLNQILITVNQ